MSRTAKTIASGMAFSNPDGITLELLQPARTGQTTSVNGGSTCNE